MGQYIAVHHTVFVQLPKLQYIQTIEVHSNMAELYQQFLLKLTSAYKELGLDQSWSVYEDVFKPQRTTRSYIFIRPMTGWSDLDNISEEDGIAKIMAKAYGENEAMQWMKIVQQSVKEIKTTVYSKMNDSA